MRVWKCCGRQSDGATPALGATPQQTPQEDAITPAELTKIQVLFAAVDTNKARGGRTVTRRCVSAPL